MHDIRPAIIAAERVAVGRLDELHDDFNRTKLLWQEVLVRDQIKGASPRFRSAKTGTETWTADEWAKSARDSMRRLRVRTFKDLAGELELFIDTFLRIWLRRFPGIVDGKSIPLSEILAATDLADVKARATDRAVESTILGKLIDRPWNWFVYLRKHCGCKVSNDDVLNFTERKAARDVLEHHDGEVDPSYLVKAGAAAVYTVGDLIEPGDADLDALYDSVRRLICVIAGDAGRHFPSVEQLS